MGISVMKTPVVRSAPTPQECNPDITDRFQAVYRAHAHSVLGYALRRAQDADDAADVFAETFLVAWRRLDDIPSDDDTRPWLFGVARKALANQRRGNLRRNRLTERLGKDLASAVLVVDNDAPIHHVIHEALQRLSEDDRETLRLTSWEGLGTGELAVFWGIPSSTARSRLYRARTRFRTELASLGCSVECPDIAGYERNESPLNATLIEEDQ